MIHVTLDDWVSDDDDGGSDGDKHDNGSDGSEGDGEDGGDN